MRRVFKRGIQTYWRMSRGLTLGAQGIVLDPNNRILLVRHTYRPGWHFPGGGVEKNETVLGALARELTEEARVAMTQPPELVGIYANFRAFPSDHIVLFLVRHWSEAGRRVPNREIAEHGFFRPEDLPESTTGAVRRRLDELFGLAPRSEWW
jgi:ADP-ribose pyrophosphatase YjhB (NUDIX family)